MSLTVADKRKIAKINALSELAGISYAKAAQEHRADVRAEIFDECEDKIVRAGVIGEYVLFDAILTDLISRHFFGDKKYSSLCKTKAYRNFHAHIMEDMSLLKKLNIVRSIIDVPKPVNEIVVRINAIRNALAHSFYPERRREYKKQGRVNYKGHTLSTLSGYKAFSEDADEAFAFFAEKYFGKDYYV